MVNVLDHGGALDALLSLRRLELIRDREIRARLAKWPDWLEDIHTMNGRLLTSPYEN